MMLVCTVHPGDNRPIFYIQDSLKPCSEALVASGPRPTEAQRTSFFCHNYSGTSPT